MKKSYLLIGSTWVLSMFFGTQLIAQEGAVPAGGNASNNTGSITYSLGQLFYSTAIGSNGTAVQGVQQPNSITVVGQDPFPESVTLSFQTYPNPTTDWLYLKVEGWSENRAINYTLSDLSGKVITSNSVHEEETTIETSQLSPATYFLLVTVDNKESKTFKILKNH